MHFVSRADVVWHVNNDDHENVWSERAKHFLREFRGLVVRWDDYNLAKSRTQLLPKLSLGFGIAFQILINRMFQSVSGARPSAEP